MKKVFFSLIFLLCSLFAFAQSQQPAAKQIISYRLDLVSVDSFYIEQLVTTEPTKENPRPQEVRTSFPFKSIKDANTFVDDIRKSATDERRKAKVATDQAITLDESALKISKLLQENAALFEHKK